MKNKLVVMFLSCILLLNCLCGCNRKIDFNYDQLDIDFLYAELIFIDETSYIPDFQSRYILTNEEGIELVKDLKKIEFTTPLRPPVKPEGYGFKLTYTNRSIFFLPHQISFADVSGRSELEDYKLYSSQAHYRVYANDIFMHILNKYVEKVESLS